MSKEVFIRGQLFWFCEADEEHFFAWLEAIPGIVAAYESSGGLMIEFRESGFDRASWYDLLGLFARYGLDMKSLQTLVVPAFVSPEDEAWLKDPIMYWHSKMWNSGI